MTTVIRHGAGSHYMRPDGVMRTSVIQPMYGYQPQADVQNVAALFTRPYGMTINDDGSLSGFGAMPGPIARLGAKIKGFFNRRKAGNFMFGGLRDSPGPAFDMASQVAPQMQSQMAMLQKLTQMQAPGQIRQAVGQASYALQMRRPYTWWYAG